MITSNRLGGHNAQILRSQGALELALTALATIAAAALLRALVQAAGGGSQTWSVSFLVASTQPLVAPLSLVPGASREVVGGATLADVTTALLLLVLPMFVLSRPLKP